jgi:hypothetical protein
MVQESQGFQKEKIKKGFSLDRTGAKAKSSK